MKKCELCGAEHEAWQAHVFPRESAVVKGKPSETVVFMPPVVTCNQCAAKDAEIERLRNQIAETVERKPKRDRAEYMRQRRAKAATK